MPRRISRKLTLRKQGVKHSGTLLGNTGCASVPEAFVICKTSGGPRSTTGAPQTIQSLASTDDDCRTGDLIKYVNIHLQAAGRDTVAADNGWMEYAVVTRREADPVIPTTRTGVQTLGDIATNMFRNECLWTGFFPVGRRMPNGVNLSIKIPKPKQFLKLGDTITFFFMFRSQLSTCVETDNIRFIASFNYKAYS